VRIEIPLYDGFDDLDAFAPNEVLRHAARAGAPFDVALVQLDGAQRVVSGLGTTVVPSGPLSERPDLVIVPGGGLTSGRPVGVLAELERGALPTVLARLHADGVTIASVCTGAVLLAAAGLLDGRPATTHHRAFERLRAAGAQIVDARVVDDGDVLTAGGVTSGLDLALWLVEREAGAEAAAMVARGIEYERRGAVWRRGAPAAQ